VDWLFVMTAAAYNLWRIPKLSLAGVWAEGEKCWFPGCYRAVGRLRCFGFSI